MTPAEDDEFDPFFDREIQARLIELEGARTSRLFLLFGAMVIIIFGVIALAAYFGFYVIGGDDGLLAFFVAFGSAAGFAVLLVVLAYLMLVRSYLRDRVDAQVLVPLFQHLLGEFKYESTSAIDDSWWRKSELFDDTWEKRRADQLVTARLGDADIQFCHLHLAPKELSPTKQQAFQGIFLVATQDRSSWSNDDAFRRSLSTTVDPPSDFQLSIDEDTLYLAVAADYPTPRANPLRPVVDASRLREFVDKLVFTIDVGRHYASQRP